MDIELVDLKAHDWLFVEMTRLSKSSYNLVFVGETQKAIGSIEFEDVHWSEIARYLVDEYDLEVRVHFPNDDPEWIYFDKSPANAIFS